MEFDYPPDGVGKPKEALIRSVDDVARVTVFEIETAERPKQRIESVAQMAHDFGLTHSVLGWVEGPIAEYADLRGVENTFMDLIDKPEMYLQAAKVIVANATRFARAQIEAGADMIGIGDAVASLINPSMYEQYVLPFEKTLIDAIHEAGATVKLHICGNIANNIGLMAQTGADIIDVDWMVSLSAAREAVGPEVTLAGNFDPTAVLLQGTPEDVGEAARKCITSAGEKFILQPGCEVPPGTPEANLRAFCPGEGCLIADDLRRRS
jgi:MtaA/CmuA family methyltransferase